MKHSFLPLIFTFIFLNCKSQTIDSEVLSSLKHFSKVYSSVRFFYPDDSFDSREWDIILTEAVEKILSTRDSKDYIDSVSTFMKKISPALIISKHPIKSLPHNSKKYREVFWQYKGFAETPHGFYMNNLTNITKKKGSYGLSKWLNQQYVLRNSSVNVSFEARIKKNNKSKLHLYQNIFSYSTRKDSVLQLVPNLSKKWKPISWDNSYNQGRSYLSFLFQLTEGGSVQIKNLNISINYPDSVFVDSVSFKYNNAESIPLTSIKEPFGYKYDLDSIKEILTISSNKLENRNWLFNQSVETNWINQKISEEFYFAHPISVSKKQYLENKQKINYQIPSKNINGISENKFAAVIKIYAVISTFFPYREELDLDWDDYLYRYLASVNMVDTDTEVYSILKMMVAELNDGHGYVKNDITFSEKCIEVDFGWFDGNLLVIGSNVSGVELGDKLLKINDSAINEVLDGKIKYRSGSPQWKNSRETMLIGCGDSLLADTYVFSRAEDTIILKVNKTGYATAHIQKQYTPIQDMGDSVYYIDLSRVTQDDFNKLIDTLKYSKGFIFDLREYPKIKPDFLGHFTQQKIFSTLWEMPLFVTNEKPIYDTIGRWEIKPKNPYLDCKVIFLVGPNTISYGESLLGIIDHYDLGLTVGTKSAGANGNMTSFFAPGGHIVYYTGMKVRQHNGEQLFVNGIDPKVNFHYNPNYNMIKGEDPMVIYSKELIITDN